MPNLSREVPTFGTRPLKTSKELAASKSRLTVAYRTAGHRKLKARGEEGSDALAFTIGRQDFGDEIDTLAAEHPDWGVEQLVEAVQFGPAPYVEPIALGAPQLIRHDDGSLWKPCYCHGAVECGECGGTGERLDTPAPDFGGQIIVLESVA